MAFSSSVFKINRKNKHAIKRENIENNIIKTKNQIFLCRLCRLKTNIDAAI